MSKTTKRKKIQIEILQDDFSPPKDNQEIVKVLSSRGNNLHEVQTSSNETYLVSMPTKFRNNLWVKRGDYILVEPIVEGDKVKAEMIRLLTSEHIKDYRKSGIWPQAFWDKRESKEDDDDLFVNTNRITTEDTDDISETESSSEEE